MIHEVTPEAHQHNLKVLREMGDTETEARAFANWVGRRVLRMQRYKDAGMVPQDAR
jgi:hypothetical protein